MVDELGGSGILGQVRPCFPSVAQLACGEPQTFKIAGLTFGLVRGAVSRLFLDGDRLRGSVLALRRGLLQLLDKLFPFKSFQFFAHLFSLALSLAWAPRADGVGKMDRDRAYEIARILESGPEFLVSIV